jgi:hypothetical protein
VSSVEVIKVDVNMNNLPSYVHDVFKETMNSCFDYELVNIDHYIMQDRGKVHDEFWDLAFYEKGVMDWLYMIRITNQPWNAKPVSKDYITLPMRTMENIMSKVRDIRNGK